MPFSFLGFTYLSISSIISNVLESDYMGAKHYIKHYIRILLSSIFAGWCIVLGTSVYLTIVNNGGDNPYLFKIIGSMFFGLGLFTIIHFKQWLFTGKVAKVLEKSPWFIIDLVVCLIGNFLGVIMLASLIKLTNLGPSLAEISAKIVEAKQNDTWHSIFILSILCGAMIYIAVIGHERCSYSLGKVLFCFIGVSIFILCGFEHCIANAAYYTFAGIFNLKAFDFFLLMIIGDSIGAIIIEGLVNLIMNVKRSEKAAVKEYIEKENSDE